jgi:hypothetical protein
MLLIFASFLLQHEEALPLVALPPSCSGSRRRRQRSLQDAFQRC